MSARVCATIGCAGAPVAVMVWSDGMPSEPVCAPCRESYSRRPSLARLVTFAGVS
jgi:hypothetical protein